MGLGNRLAHAWNAFLDQEAPTPGSWNMGTAYSERPDRRRPTFGSERSIVNAIYTRLSIDVSSIDIRHVRVDDEGRFVEIIKSGIDNCLSVEANLDQAARDLLQDLTFTLFDKGVAVIVPVDTSLNPNDTGGYDIKTVRIGEVVQWFPKKVKVNVYNDNTGRREDLTINKNVGAVVYNPLYSIMNEPNSTLQRLIRKLNLLDVVDEQSSSGKLDMIIQLPYAIKSEGRRQQAMQRRKDMEFQLRESQYGIAYADATEKVTQLNRPAENNLLAQVEYLIEMLYTQLGVTKEVMLGTADEAAMLNYINRTVEPILTAITQAMRRTFLTSTARTQGQTFMFFRDPFKLVPISNIAEIADKFTRNEILSSNEFRQIIGFKPAKDAKADQLRNSNMPQDQLGAPDPSAPAPDASAPAPDASAPTSDGSPPATTDEAASMVNAAFDGVNQTLDGIFNDLGVPG